MKDQITYTTAGGGTVVWKQDDDRGQWECKACGSSDRRAYAYEANEHASRCWAR
ncbi:hypothetical protein ACIBEJ_35280 [Nonomuraea sp. NPDC050790]|uniref:hypothetical protein n=1 Tax=Nonomuraea sp. NPDC050790 TaxID=3364371 RepID=UPI0037B046AB